MTSIKGNPCEGGMVRTKDYYMEYTKGHNYVKTGRKITVPILYTSSNDALDICTKLHEVIFKVVFFLMKRYHLKFDVKF